MARTCIIAILLTLLLPSHSHADAERVVLRSATKDQLVVVRKDGTAYVVEKGMGCLSVAQYEGRQVVIDSPGRFLGVGARLLLPEAEQDCQIWRAREVDRSAVNASAFFDSHAKAAARLDVTDDATFYLVSGEAVAYVVEDSIVGFNGRAPRLAAQRTRVRPCRRHRRGTGDGVPRTAGDPRIPFRRGGKAAKETG
jgi:hypothetical protein